MHNRLEHQLRSLEHLSLWMAACSGVRTLHGSTTEGLHPQHSASSFKPVAACSCFPQTRAGVSFLYDSEFDLTHTLKKMEEQLLKFAVNVLFNRFDLLVRSHRRASGAIYCGVSGTGVTAWICLGSRGGWGETQEKTLSSLAPVGVAPALHFTLYVRLTVGGGEQSEVHDKTKWPLFLCGWLGPRNGGFQASLF